MYIPLLTLIPFILITSSKESSNYNKVRVVTFLIGLIIIILSETTIRFVSQTTFQNLTLIIFPLILLILIYTFLFYKFKSNLKITY